MELLQEYIVMSCVFTDEALVYFFFFFYQLFPFHIVFPTSCNRKIYLWETACLNPMIPHRLESCHPGAYPRGSALVTVQVFPGLSLPIPSLKQDGYQISTLLI